MWIVFLILILLLLLTFCICTVMFWVFFTDKLIHIWRTGWTQIVRAWRQKTIPSPETWNIFFSAPLICCQRHQRAICILKNNVYRGCIVWSRSFSMTFSFLGKRTFAENETILRGRGALYVSRECKTSSQRAQYHQVSNPQRAYGLLGCLL